MLWCASRRSVGAFAFFCAVAAGTFADAQELSPQAVTEAVRALPTKVGVPGALAAATRPASPPRRPSALMPLYVSFGTLQLLDTHSTSRSIRGGAVEANPVMRPFASSVPAMLAVKAGGTAGAIVASEKLWKRNKPAAILFMLSANSGMIWVVHNNYRARRIR